jgi:hypothetical protein
VLAYAIAFCSFTSHQAMNKNTPLPLKLAQDWREVEPSNQAPAILYEREGQLYLAHSDGTVQFSYCAVGNVDCPLAVTIGHDWAYRYVCENRLGRPDFSVLRAFNLRNGSQVDVLTLTLNQWVCWMLTPIATAVNDEAQPLMGLLASDHTDDSGIVIRHQLFLFDGRQPPLRLRPLARDAFYPLAFSLKRKELIFHGAEGIYRVGFNGERINTIGRDTGPLGRGAAFCPNQTNRAILGGGGLFLWDFETNNCRELTPRGHWPAWHGTRNEIWFSIASNDLHLMQLDKDGTPQPPTPVLTAEAGRMEDVGFGCAPAIHPSGRYIMHRVQRKRLRGTTRGPGNMHKSSERVFANEEALCILDLEQKCLWQLPGTHQHATWAA